MAEKPRPWWKQRPEPAPEPEPAEADADADHDADDGDADEADAPAAANDIADGETREVQGSGAKPYVLKNIGGVYSCSCPAWMHQGVAIERRTCKHLRALRGDTAETARVGAPAAPRATARASGGAAASGVAPPILLAHTWENDVDLAGWWMSEKLDGVRAYWDGEKFLSRLGNVFVAPEWFTRVLPAGVVLDGELFGGRKKFQRTVSIVRRQDASDAWKEIHYVIFDAPKHPGGFEERLRAVQEHASRAAAEHVRAHPHEVCRGLDHVREELARVEGLGGEGLMMRRAGSRYEVGRSFTLLKVKTFHDAEARVVAHLPGTGKHKGRLGALSCELADGTRFSVGTGFSDRERQNPPAVGEVITFRYQELSNDGVPRFPSYVGVRADAVWPPAAPPARGPALASPTPNPKKPKPAPAPEPEPEPTPEAGRSARVFVQGTSTWEIRLAGATHVVRRMRGDALETTTTKFHSAAAAWRDADLRIRERLAEGFEEVLDD